MKGLYSDIYSHQQKYILVLPSSLVFITLLAASILISSFTSATDDSVVDEVSVTVPVSCSLSGTGMTSHTAEIANGTYTADIGTTTLKAFCNDNNGFAIYAAGYTGNEIGGTNSNKLIGTTASENAAIVTGTATSAGSSDVSNWAMKLATVSDPTPTYPITIDNSFNAYHEVPNSYTKVAHRDSSTDIGTNAEGATLITTYAAYISKTQAADTYSGQVIYTLVHPASEEPLQPQQATAGCINYFANASNAVGTMGCQSASDGQTRNLLASNYSREGYGFAGWSNKYDYATSTASDLKFYGPQETITVPEGTTASGLSLYAIWVPSAGSLQDSSKVSQLCGTGTGSLTTAPTDGTANLSSVSALTDQRDNQTYAIAKLADGKCWMIENLRLESTNSDNSTGALAQGYNSSFAGLANAESANFSNSTTANNLYSTDGSTDKTIDSTGGNLGYRFPRYNNYNNQSTSTNRPQNPTSNDATNSTTNAGMYSYGNYYTWHAAIADTTHNGTNNNSSDTTSICPSGWRLPHGGQTTVNTTAEFYLLGKAIMNNVEPDQDASGGYGYYQNATNTAGKTATKAIRSFPNNFLYSGYFATSSANNRGSRGYYWSSTANNRYNSYILYMYSSLVYPGTYSNTKYLGLSIRCTVSAGT